MTRNATAHALAAALRRNVATKAIAALAASPTDAAMGLIHWISSNECSGNGSWSELEELTRHAKRGAQITPAAAKAIGSYARQVWG